MVKTLTDILTTMADKLSIRQRLGALLSGKSTEPAKDVRADYTSSTGTYRLFAVSFTGEKNMGELGPVKNYLPAYDLLRMRSWQSYFESEISQIVYNRLTTWVIGSGLKLQCEPSKRVLTAEGITFDAQEFCNLTEARFSVYRKTTDCDYSGMNDLDTIASEVFKNAKIAGDVLVILRYENDVITIQTIDGEHVQSPMYGTEYFPMILKNGNRVMNGVEVDDKNNVQAYYVRSWQNPNEPFKFERIPAKSEQTGLTVAFLVYGSKYRIDNKRGMPTTSSVLETMKKMERYKEATVASAEERAKIPYTIEHGISSNGANPLLKNITKAHDIGNAKNEDLPRSEEGKQLANTVAATTEKMVFNMPVDSKLVALESKNELHFKDFYGVNIDIICASMMIPPNVAMSKYETSFSSSRAALKDWEHTLKVERSRFQKQFYQPLYNFWLLVEILKNKIQAPGYLTAFVQKDRAILGSYQMCRFVGAQVPHIDPLKEVNASRAKLGAAGDDLPLSTVEAETENLSSGESDSNMDQFALELAKGKKLKIVQPIPVVVPKKENPPGE